MSVHLLRADELRVVIRQKGFRVKALAVHVGLDVRTLERRFGEQLRTTPKAWIIRERMNSARSLLGEGLSNKQVAASLSYTCESNFCRDFKRCFGCAPQEFAHIQRLVPRVSRFDKELSRIDKRAELLRAKQIEDRRAVLMKPPQGFTTALRSQRKRGYEPDAKATLREPRSIRTKFLSVSVENRRENQNVKYQTGALL